MLRATDWTMKEAMFGAKPPRTLRARGRGLVALLGLLACGAASCKRPDPTERGRKILHLPLRTQVGSLDPVRCNAQTDNMVVSQIFEPLFQYAYDARYALEPLLLERLPEVSADGRSYTFTLQRGVYFHDDPAFPGGVGREVVAEDVIYSMKRMADRRAQPSGWWIYAEKIVGFDALKAAADARPPDAPFDPDVPVEGLTLLDRTHFRIDLVRPFPQLLHVLGTCFASVVAREVVEHYGDAIGQHPVGTGPFRLEALVPGTRVALRRHPRYAARASIAEGRTPAPSLDGVTFHVFEEDQPMWLKWRVKDLDAVPVPADHLDVAFDERRALRPTFVEEGVQALRHAKLDFIYRGFNMEDPIVGGFGRGKLVRKAIAAALDTEELADAFFSGTVVRYEGPIPPGLDGHLAKPARRGPDLERARALLREAQYPNGEGLPPIQYHTNRGGSAGAQAELIARQLARVGVRLEIVLHGFPELDALIKKKQAQMFGLAWGCDYPDAENTLALFYGPNASPGVNVFNYVNPEYDALFARARTLPPSPERTALYERLRDWVIEDAPAIGAMSRTRFYVAHRRVHHLRPDETWYTWIKYVDVDPAP